ncbi:MAG: DUF4123 domain-containing protein [Bryobacterales bacterium]|nr:DUF4123 domain-containing protein [Bryobacterales bacterium]
MKVLLEIVAGCQAGRGIVLDEMDVVRVGRSAPAEMQVPGDPTLAPQHFSIACLMGECRLQALDAAHAVLVNGDAAREAELSSGDQVLAGSTLFRVLAIPSSLEAHLAGLASRVKKGRSLRLLSLIATQPLNVYALLDGARSPRVLELLRASGERFERLDEGRAPYLAAIPPRSPLLDSLVAEGWGAGWGLFLTSRRPFGETCHHFRQILVAVTDDGRQLDFRFYDPRVLRAFLPTCDVEQAAVLFGPVSSFFAEDENPDRVLRFTWQADGARCNILPLRAQAAEAS